MPASRLWKKLHEDMYFILSYLLLKVLIWMYACLITYVLSIREKKITLWTSMLFPPGKTNMWTQCIVCLSFFFFFFFCCHVLINRERDLLGIGTKVNVFFLNNACYFVTILLGKCEVQLYTISSLEQAGG